MEKICLAQPIDLRFGWVRGFWGKKKLVRLSAGAQKKIKKVVCKIFPDNQFYDDLGEENSVFAPCDSQCMPTLQSPIDLCYRYKKTLLGKRKKVPTDMEEQARIKKVFLKIFPDAMFYDFLQEKNSVFAQEAFAQYHSLHDRIWELLSEGNPEDAYDDEDDDYLYDVDLDDDDDEADTYDSYDYDTDSDTYDFDDDDD